MDIVVKGTTVKINVCADLGEDVDMSDCNFEVMVMACPYNRAEQELRPMACNTFYADKSKCVKRDDNNYVVEVPTNLIGKGYIIARLTIDVPDDDCTSGFRREIVQGVTNIKVV